MTIKLTMNTNEAAIPSRLLLLLVLIILNDSALGVEDSPGQIILDKQDNSHTKETFGNKSFSVPNNEILPAQGYQSNQFTTNTTGDPLADSDKRYKKPSPTLGDEAFDNGRGHSNKQFNGPWTTNSQTKTTDDYFETEIPVQSERDPPKSCVLGTALDYLNSWLHENGTLTEIFGNSGKKPRYCGGNQT